MTERNLLELSSVKFDYGGGSFGLDVPNLTIAARERVALIGPSGSGKTTLINLMTGILVPQQGVITFDGDRLSALGDDARRARRIANVGMVFQQFELIEYLSAFENVLLPYFVSSHLRLDEQVRARARALAAEMKITHTLERKPAHLSQGERQRVAICRALVTDPKLVVADEPTGNLDPRTAATILDLLFETAAKNDATLIVVTHDHALLPRFDRVVDISSLAVGAAS